MKRPVRTRKADICAAALTAVAVSVLLTSCGTPIDDSNPPEKTIAERERTLIKVWIENGLYELEKGRYDAAVRNLNLVLKRDPDNPEAKRLLERALGEKKNNPRRYSEFTGEREIPFDPEVWEKAERRMRRSSGDNIPESKIHIDLDAIYDLARSAYNDGEFHKAWRLADLILHMEPENEKAKKLKYAAIREVCPIKVVNGEKRFDFDRLIEVDNLQMDWKSNAELEVGIRDAFERGVTLFKEGKYNNAIIDFLRANKFAGMWSSHKDEHQYAERAALYISECVLRARIKRTRDKKTTGSPGLRRNAKKGDLE